MPAVAWRGGPVYRGLFAAVATGAFFGALAWMDSGMVLSGVIVAVVLGAAFGMWTARRTSRFWPDADALTPADRVSVVRAARRGDAVRQPTLIPALVEYQQGLHAAHVGAGALRIRWVIWLILTAAAAMAAYDALSGSVRNTVASLIYLALLVLEFSVWPRLRDRLLHNADHSVRLSTA